MKAKQIAVFAFTLSAWFFISGFMAIYLYNFNVGSFVFGLSTGLLLAFLLDVFK